MWRSVTDFFWRDVLVRQNVIVQRKGSLYSKTCVSYPVKSQPRAWKETTLTISKKLPNLRQDVSRFAKSAQFCRIYKENYAFSAGIFWLLFSVAARKLNTLNWTALYIGLYARMSPSKYCIDSFVELWSDHAVAILLCQSR